MTKRIEFPPKVCKREECGKTFERGEQESSTKFRRRVYCSVECRQIATCAHNKAEGERRRLAVPPKTCKVCGNQFIRRTNEAIFRFNTRLTCSVNCANSLRRKTTKSSYKPKSTGNPTRKPKNEIRIVPLEERNSPNWRPPVPTPYPGRSSVTPRMSKAVHLTQAERTARLVRFRSMFQKAG